MAILIVDIRFFPVSRSRTRMGEGFPQGDPGSQTGRRRGGSRALPGMAGEQALDARVRGVGADGNERQLRGFLEIELEFLFATLLYYYFADDGPTAICVFELADV